MTAPLRWRSQLCPCGYCPDGTRIEWRYTIDIRFRPRRRVSGGDPALARAEAPAAANPSGSGPELKNEALKAITRKPVDSIGALVDWAYSREEERWRRSLNGSWNC